MTSNIIPFPSAIEARRQKLADDMRREGATDEAVARLATADTAAAMQRNETMLLDRIATLLRGGKELG